MQEDDPFTGQSSNARQPVDDSDNNFDRCTVDAFFLFQIWTCLDDSDMITS